MYSIIKKYDTNIIEKLRCDKYEIEHYEDGTVKCIKYINDDNKVHRDNAPAMICFHMNGILSKYIYFKNDEWHRENGPAYIDYDENGVLKSEAYCINGIRHREDGPAIIKYEDDGKTIFRALYYLNDIKIEDELKILTIIAGTDYKVNYND